MVDGGAAVNVMPYVTYRKLGLGELDLIKTDMMLKDFEGKTLPARGAVDVECSLNWTEHGNSRSTDMWVRWHGMHFGQSMGKQFS